MVPRAVLRNWGLAGVAMVPVTPSTSMMAYVCWVAVALPIVVLRKKAPHRFVDAFSLNLSIDSVFLRLSLDVKDAF